MGFHGSVEGPGGAATGPEAGWTVTKAVVLKGWQGAPVNEGAQEQRAQLEKEAWEMLAQHHEGITNLFVSAMNRDVALVVWAR